MTRSLSSALWALGVLALGGCYRVGVPHDALEDDASTRGAIDAGEDAGGIDAGLDAGEDAGSPVAIDAGSDAVPDTGVDAGAPRRWAWVARAGDALWQEGREIASMPDGVSAIAGFLNGYVDLGAGPIGRGVGVNDFFLARLEPAPRLDPRWAKRYGELGATALEGLAFSPDGSLVLAGSFGHTLDLGTGLFDSGSTRDVFLARLDADGAPIFARSFGSASVDDLLDVAVDPSGAIVAVGRVGNAAIDFGGGPLAPAGASDAIVCRFDASGAHVFSRRFGNLAGQAATGVAIASDPFHAGTTVVVGTVAGAIPVESGTLSSAGGTDVFVLGLDAGGNALWGRRFGDAEDQSVESVAFDPLAGRFAIAGAFRGTIDFGSGPMTSVEGWDGYVAVFSLGDFGITSEWSLRLGGADEQRPLDLAFDYVGQVIVVGYFGDTLAIGGETRTSAGSRDLFAARLGPSGSLIWLETAGDADVQSLTSVAVDGDNRIRVVGSLVGSARFDDVVLSATGGSDLLVGELVP